MKHLRRIATLGLLVGLGAGLAPSLAQDGDDELPPEIRNLGRPGQAGQDPQEELKRLFKEVEQTLRSIDDQLFDASAGDAELPDADAEIDRLLRETEESSRAALEGIDEILKIAQSMQNQGGSGGGQSSSGGQQNQQGGQSPLDGGEQGGRQERMQGEQAPDSSTDQNSETSQGQSQPQDGQPDDSRGRNAEGAATEPGERGPGSSATGGDRWGDLPPRVRAVFQNQVGDDLPVQYRQWIDRYHRRLNQ